MRHSKLLNVILAVLTCATQVACKLHGENSQQKQATVSLIKEMKTEIGGNASYASLELVTLPSYSSACANATPQVPQPRCLSIVVVDRDLPTAVDHAQALKAWLEAAPHRENKPWHGAMVVLHPAERIDKQSIKSPTPYSLARDFRVSEPIIINAREAK